MFSDIKLQAQLMLAQAREHLYFIPHILILIVLVVTFTMKSCTPTAPAPAYVVEATTNPEVTKEDKVETAILTPSKTVKTYSATAKGLITLPKSVIEDDDKFVTDSSVVVSSEKRQVVTQVLDVGTGETLTYVSVAPDPWFAIQDRGAISLDYGFKRNSSEPVARINLRQEFIQIKAIHLGISASGYSDGDYFVGIGGSYRW